MKNIILSPYSRVMRNGKVNPKNYPYFKELVALIKAKGFNVIQIGRRGEELIPGVDEMRADLSLSDLSDLARGAYTWISVDNFFPHLCNLIGVQGYVIFGPSDPEIFGHKSNINILKDRGYLRGKQFDIWEVVDHHNEAFLSPEEVMMILKLS